VLAAAIGLGPIVPPEHVHEMEEHGHHRLVVHRHAAAHPLAVPVGPHGRALHEDDDPVLILASVYTVPMPPAVPSASPATIVVLPEPAIAAVVHRRDTCEPLIHGPPRAPALLRGPPRSSCL
jgi:hypothetical protein